MRSTYMSYACTLVNVQKESAPRVVASFSRKVHSLEHSLEPWLGAERVESRVGLEEQHFGCPLVESLFKPSERLLLLAEPRNRPLSGYPWLKRNLARRA